VFVKLDLEKSKGKSLINLKRTTYQRHLIMRKCTVREGLFEGGNKYFIDAQHQKSKIIMGKQTIILTNVK
jgi:hypothetical protein